jgi:hypothetical protein
MTQLLPYEESSCFAVPLDGGWATGVVARLSGDGVVLGYFFGPRHATVPEPDAVRNLHSLDADLICMFGDLHLVSGNWPVIGKIDPWNRGEWPIPRFARISGLTGEVLAIEYHPDNLYTELSETRIDSDVASEMPPDGLFGADAVAVRLNRLLQSA